MTLKGTAKYLFGVLIAAGLLWWVLHGTDQKMLWEAIKSASIPGLLLAGFMSLGHNVFRVLRWRALLEPIRPGVPFRPMFDAVILGYLTTWTIPGRLGELVRPALLSGRERLPLGPCLGSVIADRVLDGMAVLVLFGLGLLLAPVSEVSMEQATNLRSGAFWLVGLIAIPLALLLVASRARRRLEAIFEGKAGWRGWLGRSLVSLSDGVAALRQPKLLLRVGVHTMLAWFMIAGGTWVALRSSGVEISFSSSLLLQPLLALGIAIPTPGGAGGYHAAMRIGLIQMFAIAKPLAVTASLLTHAAAILPIFLLGVVLLFVDRIPFHDLLLAARQVRELGSATPAAKRPAERLS